MKTSIIFFPNQSKRNQKTGKVPIYVRVCLKRQKSERRLSVDLTTLEILKWDNTTMRLKERNSAINYLINRLEQKFQEFLMHNSDNLPQFTSNYIIDYVLGMDKTQQKKVMEFADEYFLNSVINNVNRTPGTVKNYRRSLNHLKNYLKNSGQENLYLNQLTYEVAENFNSYLVNTNLSIKRIGMTEVSASGVIKKFRTIFTQAVDKGLMNKNPFKMVKIKTKSPRKERLTISQFNKIFHLDLTLYPAQSVYRDIFLFCTFTGLAYKDAMNISWKNLEQRDNNNYKLSISRTKTDVITESFLPSYAIEIAKKFKLFSETQIQGKVLPLRSNKELNLQLKDLAFLSGISIKLSTHIARHTFRQLLSEAGIEDYGIIKRMMGQSRNGDVDEVYYSVTENKLFEAKNKFQNYLDKNLLNIGI